MRNRQDASCQVLQGHNSSALSTSALPALMQFTALPASSGQRPAPPSLSAVLLIKRESRLDAQVRHAQAHLLFEPSTCAHQLAAGECALVQQPAQSDLMMCLPIVQQVSPKRFDDVSAIRVQVDATPPEW
eukprot:960433-Pyramimonas_sp.AAC.1